MKILLIALLVNFSVFAENILIPMDTVQTDHLKAYGLAYYALKENLNVQWLLNYRGGSFLVAENENVKNKALIMDVAIEHIDTLKLSSLYSEIQNQNMDRVILEKAPKIAVYTPPNKNPWDDAVTLALTYSEIPYDIIWDTEVLNGQLYKYDWLHLHHEDFTGQYGKFYGSYRNAPWYQKQVQLFTQTAYNLGYSSVQQQKYAVAAEIKNYVKEGGFLFAMCSATDSLDIALAAENIDIIPSEIDGTPLSLNAQNKLDFSKCLAFTDFQLEKNAYVYEFSNIDVTVFNPANPGSFHLFEFSAKYDRTPTILTQNHENIIMNFLGQTTAYNKNYIKKNIVILGEIDDNTAKYIHGVHGKGSFTFLGGHDPEDYAHAVGEKPTNLEMYKNSPGYRLILNNILYPSAKKKKLKT